MKPRHKLKMYASLGAAQKAANDRPFLRVGDVYIVPHDPNGTFFLGAVNVEILGLNQENGLMHGAQMSIAILDAFAPKQKRPYRLPKIEM